MELIGLAGMCLLGGFGFLVLYALGGFIIVQPKTQVVVLRFGKFTHTIAQDGIAYVFPLGRKIYRVSSAVFSVDLPRMMVLEGQGNPIEVGAMISYEIRDARRALLEVHDVHSMIKLLATAVVKNVCAQFPYASDNPHEPCLRKEDPAISQALINELQELVAPAGVHIHQVRLNDLTYAPEIAQSMLLRQQASAMVDARRTMVEGAATTVLDIHSRLGEIGFDRAYAEGLVANLMLVLCSGERVQTVMPVAADRGGAR